MRSVMKFKLIALILITNISVGQDIDKKYPDLIKRIVEINNNKNYEIVSFKVEELKGPFKGESLNEVQKKLKETHLVDGEYGMLTIKE